MSCFLCFGSAQEGEAKKPSADAKDARKDGSADRGVSRLGSGARGGQLDLGNCLSLYCGFEIFWGCLRWSGLVFVDFLVLTVCES